MCNNWFWSSSAVVFDHHSEIKWVWFVCSKSLQWCQWGRCRPVWVYRSSRRVSVLGKDVWVDFLFCRSPTRRGVAEGLMTILSDRLQAERSSTGCVIALELFIKSWNRSSNQRLLLHSVRLLIWSFINVGLIWRKREKERVWTWTQKQKLNCVYQWREWSYQTTTISKFLVFASFLCSSVKTTLCLCDEHFSFSFDVSQIQRLIR